MAAITNVDGDIQTQTSTLSSAISTARQAVIDDITTSEGALSTLITNTDTAQTSTLSSAISTARQAVIDDITTSEGALSTLIQIQIQLRQVPCHQRYQQQDKQL